MRLSRSILAAVGAVAVLATGATAASAAPVADDHGLDRPGQRRDRRHRPARRSGTCWPSSWGPRRCGCCRCPISPPASTGCSCTRWVTAATGSPASAGRSTGLTSRRCPSGPMAFAEATFSTSSDDLAGLDDLDGVSLVVHALPDNRANIPARYQSSQSSSTGADAITNDTGDVGAGIVCAPLDVETGFSEVEADRARTGFEREAKAARDSRAAARGGRRGPPPPTSSKPTWSTPPAPGAVASASSPDRHRPACWSRS